MHKKFNQNARLREKPSAFRASLVIFLDALRARSENPH